MRRLRCSAFSCMSAIGPHLLYRHKRKRLVKGGWGWGGGGGDLLGHFRASTDSHQSGVARGKREISQRSSEGEQQASGAPAQDREGPRQDRGHSLQFSFSVYLRGMSLSICTYVSIYMHICLYNGHAVGDALEEWLQTLCRLQPQPDSRGDELNLA